MKTKFVTLFLALIAGIGTLFAESGTCGDNLTWDLTDSVLTISGTGDMDGYGFADDGTYINTPWKNYQEQIAQIVINNGVTSIGKGAFYQCSNLSDIIISNSVTSINDEAFNYCSSLTSINIPFSVTFIGARAFQCSYKLTTINVANSNLNYCDIDGILFTKDQTALIRYPAGKAAIEYTIPNSVASIGNYAFDGCHSLTRINIPTSVTSIGDCTFSSCFGLTSIKIPNSVTSIGQGAFAYCPYLKNVTLPNSITSIAPWTFHYCDSLTNITIPNTVETIGERAFSVSGLTSVIIPESVMSIGIQAFGSCIKLADIYVADMNSNYCDIDGVLFNKDTTELIQYPRGKAATKCIIPHTVISIDGWAFANAGLINITCKAIMPPTCGSNVFNSINKSQCIIYVPAGSVDAYKAADQWKDFENILPIEEQTPCPVAFGYCGADGDSTNLSWELSCDSVLTISGNGNMADWWYNKAPWYEHRSEIRQVVLPNGLINIGSYAFYECGQMRDVNIPSGLTSIGKGAFQRCWGLLYIDMPNSVTDMGESVFCYNGFVSMNVASDNPNYCSVDGALFNKDTTTLIYYNRRNPRLSYIIPNSVTNIEQSAFIYCIETQEIAIPASVTTIGARAFSQCYGLESIYSYASTPPTCGENAFEGINKSTCTIYVPAGSVDAYKAADQWKDFENILPIGETIPCGYSSQLKMINLNGYPIEGFASDKYNYTFKFPAGTNPTLLPTVANVSWITDDDCQTVSAQQVGTSVMLVVISGNSMQRTYLLNFIIEQSNQFIVTTLSNNTEWGTAIGGNTYNADSKVEIGAFAKDGYQFYQWNNAIKDNPYSFTLTQDTSFVATFLPDTLDGIVTDVTSDMVHMEWEIKPWGNKGYWIWIYVDRDHKHWYCKMRFYEDGTLDKFYWGPASKHYDESEPDQVTSRHIHRSPARYFDSSSVISYDLEDIDSGTEYFYILESLDATENVVSAQAGTFSTEEDPTTITNEVSHGQQPIGYRKVLRNGQLFILCGDQLFNAQGARVE